ncbi:hypothetical protein ABS767_00670 [Sphingomonas sp. ST-64]|uniref:Uncharacterized protein n=1 Tax=Sphingomonas plantiphila TaxID=3163295 RepID=A0ABW8YJT4_9SPHN
MAQFCHLIGHQPGDDPVWNEGYFFTRCTRCGRDMMRADGPWRSVPRKYRVAWRSGYHRHAVPSDFGRRLPVAASMPAKQRAKLPRHSVGCVLMPSPHADERGGDVDGMEQAIAAFRLLRRV